MEPETRYARSGDLWIAYQVSGEGPFDVVFVSPFLTHVELQWTLPGFDETLAKLGSFSSNPDDLARMILVELVVEVQR